MMLDFQQCAGTGGEDPVVPQGYIGWQLETPVTVGHLARRLYTDSERRVIHEER